MSSFVAWVFHSMWAVNSDLYVQADVDEQDRIQGWIVLAAVYAAVFDLISLFTQ